jgi:transposase
MPQKGLPMRTLRELLRLRWSQGCSAREVARACQVSHSTVLDYEKRARAAGLGWPLPEELDDDALAALVADAPSPDPPVDRRPLPDVPYVLRELRKKHVTMQLLWAEYRTAHPAGYGYTQFCHYVNAARKVLDPTLRQVYRAGEKLLTDFAGDTMDLIDATTGAVSPAYLFVAVFGASHYTYVRAVADMQEARWIGLHVRAFEFFGGVPEAVVCDNTATAVTKADRYEPVLHPLFADMAAHYGTIILPARAGKPRDKAPVEGAVLIAERWIIAALRHHQFFSLAELNDAIVPLLDQLNARLLQRLQVSRRALFDAVERPALRPLPPTRYTFEQWKTATVAIDYHVCLDKHFYSVPYQLVGNAVEARLSPDLVEILSKGRRVASHLRSYVPGQFTTDPAHRPKSHQAHLEWSPSRLIRWARETVGPQLAALVQGLLERRPHPEHGYRACLGLMSLAKKYPPERMEAAAQRAIAANAYQYQSVKSILASGLDQLPLPDPPALQLPPAHENLRGRDYYR